MATFNFASKTYAAGTHIIGPFTMPSGIDIIEVAFTVAVPDINDPTETLDYEMDCSRDGGNTWTMDNGFAGWKGGALDKHGQPVQPYTRVDGMSALAGLPTRIIITNTKPMTVAIDVTTS
jgi:hypothetical protein